VGDEDDTVARERNARAAGRDPFLELQVPDPALVDAGVEGSGDALYDCRLVFSDSVGQARQLVYRSVGLVELRAVCKQPAECLGGAQAALRRRGGDPPGDQAGRGWPLVRCVDRQTAA
jgi:hypothetical protein